MDTGTGSQGRLRGLRRWLVGVVALGIGATGVASGTFASFSASTTNAGSSFATGTLVLSNQKDTATACLSTAGGSTDANANGGCDSLFALTVRKPGDAATVNVTLKNEGSLAASALRGFAAAACAASNAPGQSHAGTGNSCTAVSVYVQEFSDSGRVSPSTCHYGGGTVTTCDYDATKTLATFGTDHPDATEALELGAAAGGATRWFTVGVRMDATAGNEMQGRQATFGFTWQLVQ